MPTLGAHFDEKTAAVIETAAKVSPEKKVGPWLATAARQRLERDGYAHEANIQRAELLATAEQVGLSEALDTLRGKLRRTPAAIKTKAA